MWKPESLKIADTRLSSAQWAEIAIVHFVSRRDRVYCLHCSFLPWPQKTKTSGDLEKNSLWLRVLVKNTFLVFERNRFLKNLPICQLSRVWRKIIYCSDFDWVSYKAYLKWIASSFLLMWQVWSVTAQRSVTKSVTHVTSEKVNDLTRVWQIWIICQYPVSILLPSCLSSAWPWVRTGHSCTDRLGARASTFISAAAWSLLAGLLTTFVVDNIKSETKRWSREPQSAEWRAEIQRVKKNSVRKTSPASLY